MINCNRCGATMNGYPEVRFRAGAAGSAKPVRTARTAGLYEEDTSDFLGIKGAMRYTQVELCADCLRELVAWLYGEESIEEEDTWTR